MTESPKYELIRKDNNIEIRRYAPYIKAEVDVSGTNYRNAIEKGFTVLAGYIFGNNQSRQNVEMTSPVQASQKIAMTTPVTVTGDEKFVVAFIMPSKFTLETLPVPNDKRIRLIAIPEQLMAVIRFSGYFNQKSIEKHKKELEQFLLDKSMETEGDFIIAGYNPPWVPGIFARNEIMIPIRKLEN